MDKALFLIVAVAAIFILVVLLWILRDTTNIRADARAVLVNTLGTMSAFALAVVGFSIQDGISEYNIKSKENSDFISRTNLYLRDIEKAVDETSYMLRWINSSNEYCSSDTTDSGHDDFNRFQLISSALTRRASFKFSQTNRDLGPYLIRFNSKIYGDVMLAIREMEGVHEQLISVKDRLNSIISHTISHYTVNKIAANEPNPAMKTLVCSVTKNSNQTLIITPKLYGVNLAYLCALKSAIVSGKSPESLNLKQEQGRDGIPHIDLVSLNDFKSDDGIGCLDYSIAKASAIKQALINE